MKTYVGGDQVAELFKEIDNLEAEGVEQYGITDIMSYPVKMTIPKTKFIEQRLKTQKKLLKLRKQGKMKDYHIVEKIKAEKHLKELGKERGKKYLAETLKHLKDSLNTGNFHIGFAENVSFKFFVIPDKIAVISWFSSPNKKYLDCAIAFWYPDSIKSLEEYFWIEWKKIKDKDGKKWINGLVKK